MVTGAKKRRLKRIAPADLIFRLFNGFFLTLFAAATALPLVYVFFKSLTSYRASETGLRTVELNSGAYSYIFGDDKIYGAFFLTVGVVIISTVLHIAVTLLAAYPLSKKHLRGRNAMLIFVLITMVFNGGLIPYYVLITQQLDIDNNLLVYILPGLVSGFSIIIMKNFLGSILPSLEESARIDGATDFRVLFSVVLPLCKPIIATIGLWFAVFKWNDYMTGMLYMTKGKYQLIQNLLRDMLISNQGMGNMLGLGHSETYMLMDNVKMAVIIIATVPIICLYPFVQKYFIHGVMLGSVKE